MRCWLCDKIIVVPDFDGEGIREAGSIRAGTAGEGKKEFNRNASIGVTCACGARYKVTVRLEEVDPRTNQPEGQAEEERRRGWR